MRRLIMVTSLSLGLGLLLISSLLASQRQADSAAYWLFVEHPSFQNGQREYFLMSPDGRIRKNLLPSVPDNYNWYLGWSDDGKYIFYRVNFITDETPEAGIFRLNIYSGESELLVEVALGYEDTYFTASPDKKWFALRIPEHDGQSYYIISADGTHIHTLPEIAYSEVVWSQDSQAIYYADYVDDEYQQLRLNLDNQQSEAVAWAETFYRYAPDRSAYAFFENDQRDIWYIHDLDVDKITRLTPDDENGYFVLGWLGYNWILVQKNSNGEIYRVQPDGSHWELILGSDRFNNSVLSFAPFWDETGEWVYFEVPAGVGVFTLERLHIDSLEREIIIPKLESFDTTSRQFEWGEPLYIYLIRELDTIIWLQSIDAIPRHFELRQIQSDGTNEQVLLKVDEYFDFFDIKISPDNQWVYITTDLSTRGGYVSQVWRANLHKRQQEQILSENDRVVDISAAVDLDYAPQRLQLGGGGLLILGGLGLILFRQR